MSLWKVIERKIVYINNKKPLATKWIKEHNKSNCQYELVEVDDGNRRNNKAR